MSPSQPYDALARSLERELELIGEGPLDELTALYAQRQELIESLPAVPPADARPALQRAALMNKRVEIEILRRREALVLESANVERVGRTARGYAATIESRPQLQATA
ncbi:MAG TPA: hypothetical protein VFH80_19990 [Solirubrobacteraceae bacterium]|nr:hypothetical protein [Solirubrobacteraceae bacterium]